MNLNYRHSLCLLPTLNNPFAGNCKQFTWYLEFCFEQCLIWAPRHSEIRQLCLVEAWSALLFQNHILDHSLLDLLPTKINSMLKYFIYKYKICIFFNLLWKYLPVQYHWMQRAQEDIEILEKETLWLEWICE